MHVLLINPTRTGVDSYVSPPLHLVCIATACYASGHTAEIIDAHYDYVKQNGAISKIDFENAIIERIASKKFDVLGIGGIISSFNFSKNLSNYISEHKPGIPIIIGGGMSIALKDLWASKTRVDFLVEADGEILIQQFLEAYPDKEKLKLIKGLHTRENDQFLRNPPASTSLENIAFPNWDLLPNAADYIAIQKTWWNGALPSELGLGEKDTIMPIVMTRGCPYHCTFCYHISSRWASHPAEHIISYIKHLKEKFGITYIGTWDDLIMVNRNWLTDLCDKLIEEKLEIKFFTSGGKPNLINEKLVEKMYQAGFRRISFGIESGSQTILDLMKKQTTVEQNFNAIKMSTKAGLFVHLNMILGMPGETYKTLKETSDFLKSLAKEGLVQSKNLSFSYATSYPGTELHQYAKEHKLIIDDDEVYLLNQSGVGFYSNLCGISAKSMRFRRDMMIATVEYYFWKYQKRELLALKSYFKIMAKGILLFALPNTVIMTLRKSRGFLSNLGLGHLSSKNKPVPSGPQHVY